MEFDEQDLYDTIKSELNTVFATDDWYVYFGKNAMQFTDEVIKDASRFPVIYIEITDPQRDKRTNDSSKQDKFTKFWFVIEQFNKAVFKKTKTTVGRAINKQIVSCLVGNFNPYIDQNHEVSNIDDGVYRRYISGYCTIDNSNKVFYK